MHIRGSADLQQGRAGPRENSQSPEYLDRPAAPGGLGRCRQKNAGPSQNVTIAVVGKYVNLIDSYKSLNEALIHGGIPNDCSVSVKFVDSEKIETEGFNDQLNGIGGIIFWSRVVSATGELRG